MAAKQQQEADEANTKEIVTVVEQPVIKTRFSIKDKKSIVYQPIEPTFTTPLSSGSLSSAFSSLSENTVEDRRVNIVRRPPVQQHTESNNYNLQYASNHEGGGVQRWSEPDLRPAEYDNR